MRLLTSGYAEHKMDDGPRKGCSAAGATASARLPVTDGFLARRSTGFVTSPVATRGLLSDFAVARRVTQSVALVPGQFSGRASCTAPDLPSAV